MEDLASEVEVIALPEPMCLPLPPRALENQVESVKLLYDAQLKMVLARYQAQLDAIQARYRDQNAYLLEQFKVEQARTDQTRAIEGTLRAAVQDAYLDAAKGMVERGLQRADFVTKVAGAVATTYSALLGLAFSVTSDTPRPLPAHGFAPAIFLGLALVLSAFYVGYLGGTPHQGLFLLTGTRDEFQQARMLKFIEWTSSGSMDRAWALRCAIVSLGIGVMLTPMPFLTLSSDQAWVTISIGTCMVITTIIVELWRSRRSRSKRQAQPDTKILVR